MHFRLELCWSQVGKRRKRDDGRVLGDSFPLSCSGKAEGSKRKMAAFGRAVALIYTADELDSPPTQHCMQPYLMGRERERDCVTNATI